LTSEDSDGHDNIDLQTNELNLRKEAKAVLFRGRARSEFRNLGTDGLLHISDPFLNVQIQMFGITKCQVDS